MSSSQAERGARKELYYKLLEMVRECEVEELVAELDRNPKTLERLAPLHDRGEDLGVELLAEAASRADKATTRALIERGVDPDGRVAGTRTPLIQAVETGDPPYVALLIELGADPWHAGYVDNGIWPIHHAAGNGWTAILDLLLTPGKDLDLLDLDSYAPLHWATDAARAAAVRWLVEHGASPSIRAGRGSTPLFHSITLGHVQGVSELLHAGVSVDESVPFEVNPVGVYEWNYARMFPSGKNTVEAFELVNLTSIDYARMLVEKPRVRKQLSADYSIVGYFPDPFDATCGAENWPPTPESVRVGEYEAVLELLLAAAS